MYRKRVVLRLVVKIIRTFRDKHSSELDLLFFRRIERPAELEGGSRGNKLDIVGTKYVHAFHG